jgi:hypothetical protein
MIHVVAITPRVHEVHVGLKPARICVANHVQPAPSPALAITRRRQQSVDQLLISIRSRIVDELLHFLRRGRQPVQIEIGAPNQRAPAGGGDRVQSFVFQLGEDERINRITDPARILNYRGGSPAQFAKRPPRRF